MKRQYRDHKKSGIPEAAIGAEAARRLAEACATDGSQVLKTVGELADDLRRELELYASGATTPVAGTLGLTSEVAARCADLASLAACNAVHLPETRMEEAATATHLAAGAARSLGAGVEASSTPPASYEVRDARGAGWRARLAAQQIDALLQARSTTSD